MEVAEEKEAGEAGEEEEQMPFLGQNDHLYRMAPENLVSKTPSASRLGCRDATTFSQPHTKKSPSKMAKRVTY